MGARSPAPAISRGRCRLTGRLMPGGEACRYRRRVGGPSTRPRLTTERPSASHVSRHQDGGVMFACLPAVGGTLLRAPAASRLSEGERHLDRHAHEHKEAA